MSFFVVFFFCFLLLFFGRGVDYFRVRGRPSSVSGDIKSKTVGRFMLALYSRFS